MANTTDPPRTHTWFLGLEGKLVFAVLVEDGGVEGRVAAPLAPASLGRSGPSAGPAHDMEPRPRTLTDEDIQTMWTRVVSADLKVIGIYVPRPDRSNYLDVGDLFPGDLRNWGDYADGMDHSL